MQRLVGYRTYICSVALAGVGVAFAFGWIDEKQAAALGALTGALTQTFQRAAMDRIEKSETKSCPVVDCGPEIVRDR